MINKIKGETAAVSREVGTKLAAVEMVGSGQMDRIPTEPKKKSSGLTEASSEHIINENMLAYWEFVFFYVLIM